MSYRQKEPTIPQESLYRALGGKPIRADIYATPTFMCAPLKVTARHGPRYILDLHMERKHRPKGTLLASLASAAVLLGAIAALIA